MVDVQTLQHTDESFERKSPPSVDGAEQFQALLQVQRQVMVRDEIVAEDTKQGFEVSADMVIEACGPRLAHRPSCGKVDSANKMEEVVQ